MNINEAPDYVATLQGGWEALGNGAPTLVALAQVCAHAIIRPLGELETLNLEAKTILYAARNRGMIEVRGVNTAFEASARMLAVYVEEDEHRTIAFRNRENPKVTMRFFEGMCQLCRNGLVVHHLFRDFSLTERGFTLAAAIDLAEVQESLGEATDIGLVD